MDIFNSYATDENLENNGTDFPLGDATLLIARAGNRKYSREITKAVEKRRVELDQGGPDATDAAAEAAGKVSDEIMVDVMARTILLGWGGNFTFKGAPMAYSEANARTVLAVKDFRKHVASLAESMEAYKAKAEVATGNV